MRDLAGLLLLYFGAAWKAEQTTSHARQPLHLSRSTFIVLTIFFFFSPMTAIPSSPYFFFVSAEVSLEGAPPFSVKIPLFRKSSATYSKPSACKDSFVG